MRISDCSSDVCSSDLPARVPGEPEQAEAQARAQAERNRRRRIQQPRIPLGEAARAAAVRLLHCLRLGDHGAGVSSFGWPDLYRLAASIIQAFNSSNCLIRGKIGRASWWERVWL